MINGFVGERNRRHAALISKRHRVWLTPNTPYNRILEGICVTNKRNNRSRTPTEWKLHIIFGVVAETDDHDGFTVVDKPL